MSGAEGARQPEAGTAPSPARIQGGAGAAPRAPARPLRSTLLRGGAALLGLLLVGEVLARLVPLPAAPDQVTAAVDLALDPLVGFRLRPGWHDATGEVQVNQRGFRDADELPNERPADQPWVLMLGDSQAFGASVRWPDVVSEQLEGVLAARHVRVVNASVPCYGLIHERLLLEQIGPQVRPQAIVLAVSISTDLLDALTFLPDDVSNLERRTFEQDGQGRLVVTRRAQPLIRRLARRSALWWRFERSPLYGVLRSLGRRKKPKQPGAGMREERFYALRVRLLATLRKLEGGRGAWEEPPLRAGWESIAADLLRLKEAAARAGAPLLVMLIPDEMQVVPEVLASTLESTTPPLRREDFDLEQPQRAWRAACEQAGIAVVDLLPAFRAAPDRAGLYLRLDTHMSPAGHKLAAETTAPALRALLER